MNTRNVFDGRLRAFDELERAVLEIPRRHNQERQHCQTHHEMLFRFSDAGRCHYYRYMKRWLALQRGIFRPEPNIHKLGVFEAGYMIESWLTNGLQEMNMIADAQVEITDEHRIGHADLIVTTHEGDLVIDCKSMAWKFWEDVEAKRYSPRYQMQVGNYYLELSARFPNIVGFGLVYVRKDDLKPHIARLSMDSLLRGKIQTDWSQLIESWTAHQPPNPIYREDHDCSDCWIPNCPHKIKTSSRSYSAHRR